MSGDTIPQGLSIDGLRASKRVGLAKAKVGLLDLIGLDEASGVVDGFRLKAQRNIYDEETARVSVESPPGMYLAVVNGTQFQVFSSESDGAGGADMGNPTGPSGFAPLLQQAPTRFQMIGLQNEGVGTNIQYERQPGSPYGDRPFVHISGTASSPVAPYVGVIR